MANIKLISGGSS